MKIANTHETLTKTSLIQEHLHKITEIHGICQKAHAPIRDSPKYRSPTFRTYQKITGNKGPACATYICFSYFVLSRRHKILKKTCPNREKSLTPIGSCRDLHIHAAIGLAAPLGESNGGLLVLTRTQVETAVAQ